MDKQIKILVTGANGQLGQEIRRCSDMLPQSLYHFTFAGADELNIVDHDAVDAFIKENEIDYIINCAAYTAVDKAEDDAVACFATNFEGVQNLGNAAKKYNAKVIHISTDYVFDGTNTRPYVETDSVSPKSIYGSSKEKGEQALLNTCSNSIIIRTSWLYSIYGNNFVKTMIKLGHDRETLTVVADQMGTPTNARDLAQAILQIINHSRENNFCAGIYHYANEGVTTWYDFTKAIHREAGITSCKVSPITTDQYPTKAVRPKYSVLDKSKIKSTFNITIPHWEGSLKDCIAEL